jgi:hypothetical protein
MKRTGFRLRRLPEIDLSTSPAYDPAQSRSGFRLTLVRESRKRVTYG